MQIKHENRDFLVTLHDDDHYGAPWMESDGHGVIREVYCRGAKPDKKPGEVIIHSSRGDYWLYDVQETLKIARRDGWGLPKEEKTGLTKAQIVARAVQKDMEYCAGYLNGTWSWVGVGVQIIGADGEPEGGEYDNAIWGVESTGNYWREVAEELASQILHDKKKAWRAVLRETREFKYWANRGVVTE